MSAAMRTRADRDRRLAALGLVEAEIAGAARAGGEQRHPLDHPADSGDVAVEVARRMADHRIELAARAGVRREVAADADAGVAMGEPGHARAPDPRRPASRPHGRPSAHSCPESRAGGSRGRRAAAHIRPAAARRRPAGSGDLGVAIAPLGDIIVLHPVDGGVVPPAGAGEAADVGDMDRREIGRELDDHRAAVGQIDDQQILADRSAASPPRSNAAITSAGSVAPGTGVGSPGRADWAAQAAARSRERRRRRDGAWDSSFRSGDLRAWRVSRAGAA